MKKIPSKPRLHRSLRIAKSFILEQKINHLPVDPFELAKKNGWEIKESKEIGSILNIHPAQVLRGRDADIFYYKGKYKIIYNEFINSKDRIRWTIMHEIGHIVLSHLIDFENTNLSRSFLSNSEYQTLERETNIFAAEVLAPMTVLKALNISKRDDIIQVCKLSREAAEFREDDLKKYGDDHNYLNSETQLRWSFKDFLEPITFCSNTPDVPQEISNIPSRLLTKLRRIDIMTQKKDSVSVDANGRVEECAKCGNVLFSKNAKYCKMCGTNLFNECSNIDDRRYESECGEKNAGDARHCEYCGNETYMLRAGLLYSWEELHKRDGHVFNGVSAPPIDDSDLPF